MRTGALTRGVPEAELDALRVDLEAGRVVLEHGGDVALPGDSARSARAHRRRPGPGPGPDPGPSPVPTPAQPRCHPSHLGEAVLGKDVEQRSLAALAVPHHHDLALHVLVGIHHRLAR